MRKNWKWIAFLAAAAAEAALLFWVRGSFLVTAEEGTVYTAPVSVNFDQNFYNRNYIPLHVSVTKAMWNGKERPATGDEVCLAVSGGKDHVMEALRAQPDRPSGDYVLVRVKSVDGDVVHFDFPADRLYLDAEDIRKISVSELSERVRVKDPETNRVETRLKNSLSAEIRVKEGRAVITDLLVNGSPVKMAYTTVGEAASVKYAARDGEEDEFVPMAGDRI